MKRFLFWFLLPAFLLALLLGVVIVASNVIAAENPSKFADTHTQSAPAIQKPEAKPIAETDRQAEDKLVKLCRNPISKQWAEFHYVTKLLGKYTFDADENGAWLIWPWSGDARGNGKIGHIRSVTFCHLSTYGEFNYLTGSTERDTPDWWKVSSTKVASVKMEGTERLKSEVPKKCRAYVRSKAELPDSISFGWIADSDFTKEDSDSVIYRENFTAKNHFNAEIPYTATCTLASSGDFLGNIQPR
jgi:hypothetical protein